MLSAKGPIRTPRGKILEAVRKIQDFRYRSLFRLSYEEFLDEPFDVFAVNTEIMNIEASIEQGRIRAAKRKGKP